MNPSFQSQWAHYKDRANQQLGRLLTNQGLANRELTDSQSCAAGQLAEAMQYSTQNGGKRFRAMLVYASGHCFGAQIEALDAPAIALELIHAYSLIHDDLPAMDDDSLRRGQASCHIQFDEATAILAGDALQTLAFDVLSTNNAALSASQQLQMIQNLSHASGLCGMAGGQSLDIIATGKTLKQDALQLIHEHKTGALIRSALTLGGLASADIQPQELRILDAYGHDIGLAFQVVDDILDLTQSSEKLGKTSGADAALDKNTYPDLMGLEGARQYAGELIHSARQSLGKLRRDTFFLSQLAEFTLNRDH